MTMVHDSMTECKAGVQETVESLLQWVQTAAGAGEAAHVVERSLFQRLLQLGHRLMGIYFELQGDVGAILHLPDGRTVRRLEQPHKRRYHSLFGKHELSRVVYGSREGQRIERIPLDERLQLPQSTFSYVLQDWSQSLAVEMSYGQVREVLRKFVQVDIGISSLERMTRDFSSDAQAYWDHSSAEPAPQGQFVVASADGKGVPIRKPSNDASIADHDPGKKPKPDRKKMALLGAVYDSEPHVRTPEQVIESLFGEPLRKTDTAANDSSLAPRPKPIAKAIRACLTHPDDAGREIHARNTLFPWLAEQVEQRDPTGEKPVVVIMDGQISLWNDAEPLFGERPRVEILDLLHATSKLWEMIHLCYPKEREWESMKFFTWLLLQGKVQHIIVWFQDAARRCALHRTERKKLGAICAYFERHQARMRYDHYLANGYPIASGVIEGACRHVVKDRLERTGMRWTLAGAQNMLHLRCMAINDQWDRYSQFHIDRENKRLYASATASNQAPCTIASAA